MIYLIDDKRERQSQDYNWGSERLNDYNDFIIPIYNPVDFDGVKEQLLADNNPIMLYHESFCDDAGNSEINQRIKEQLLSLAQSQNKLLVFFSGSKSGRVLDGNVAHIPVSILYQNLEVFIKKYANKIIGLEYLLYGENPKIEEELIELLIQAREKIDNESCANIEGSTLFLDFEDVQINSPIQKADEYLLSRDHIEFFPNDLSPELKEKLLTSKYDHIFIPLCFGSSLSDFNGLRIATHIRCTECANQLSNIFIYGPIDHSQIINNKYYDILKTKNVAYTEFSKAAFEKHANRTTQPLLKEQLPREIKKINLPIPKNYYDNHSISNEWAIYQWSQVLGIADTSDFEFVSKNIQDNLYFKYLRMIHPIPNNALIPDKSLRVDTKEIKPRLLIIDDEVDKGWYKILAYLFGDINEFWVDYLGDNFKQLSKEEIIECSLNKIKSDDIDIVILDYRLTEKDFFSNKPDDKTSISILKKIKEFNPGIQVITFSVTEKIQHMQALDNAGCDSFVNKSTNYNEGANEIRASIFDLIKRVEVSTTRLFLKDFYKGQIDVIKELEPRKKFSHPNLLPKEFVDEAIKWLKFSNSVLNEGELNEFRITSSFIMKFAVLENISNRVIDIDNPIESYNKYDEIVYNFQFRKNEDYLKMFTEDKESSGFFTKTNTTYYCPSRILPWTTKTLNTLYFIGEESVNANKLSELVKKRNDFIHSNPTTGDASDINIDDLVFLNKLIINGLKNII